MSDQEDLPDETTPEGMVRRTRRVRKKRRNSDYSTAEKDASSLFSKAKELLVGMHKDEDDDYGPVDVAEQVRRLKNRKNKDDDKPLDDVWGTKKRSASWLWIVLIGIIVPVIGIVIGVTVLADNKGYEAGKLGAGEMGGILEDTFDAGEGPLGWYSGNSTEVIDEVISIIGKINEAESADEIEPLLRTSPYRALNPIDLADWGQSHLTNALSNFRWESIAVHTPGLEEATTRGVLKVRGSRVDLSPFVAYFVHENGKVVLDWEATTGWSEMTVAEIAGEKPRKGTMVRCLYEKKPTFDQKFGNTEYSGYVILSPDQKDYLFAFIPLNSEENKEMDRAMRRGLDYGWLIDPFRPILKNQRVTLSIRRGNNEGDNGIFEITEFRHADWVTP